MEQAAEQQIVELARRGDPESFETLYERYYPTMVWLAYSILVDRNQAEDAAQQTFVKACEKLGSLKQADRFAPWLAAICRNESQQLIRRRQHRLSWQAADADYAVQNDAADADHEMVRAAIHGLAPMYREIIILHYFNGMDYPQIASTLGVAMHTVRGRLFRARKQIERTLRRNGYPER